MRIQIDDPAKLKQQASGPVFFASGFRPFFILAGMQAVVALAAWLAMYFGLLDIGGMSPLLWHGHEMVFGFGLAAVGGFLLTAVPNWTGAASLSGRPVAILAALWLAGRVAFWLVGILPGWLVTVVELAFLPVLAGMLAGPLIAAGKVRNIVFLPILALFLAADALVGLELLGVAGTGMAGVYAGIYILLLMIAIVGGRIIPAFTATALRMRRIEAAPQSHGWLEIAAPASVVIVGAADLTVPGSAAFGWLALAGCLVHAVRLAGWQTRHVLGQPILWILHAGYAWLIVGLALRGMSAFTDAVPPSAALHAFTAGTIGSMVLGVMTRAALGHSGRPLQLATATVAAYVLVQVGAVLRVFLPIVAPSLLADVMPLLSGLLWAGGFAVFVAVYLPIVTRPRIDGRPG